MGRFLIQPHGRLQEWVAEELGYLRDEGLDYDFTEGFAVMGVSSSVQTTDEAPVEVRSGAFEDMSAGRTCNVSSGSHYSAIQGLAPFLGRDQISLKFVGRPIDRMRLLLQRKIPAVNVFGPQYYLAEQQGLVKVVDTTFMMGFLLTNDADMQDTEKYFRALRRAQWSIDLEPEAYKHYYL